EVVAHDVDPVERSGDLWQLPGAAAQITCGQRCREQVALVQLLADGVELTAELLQKQRRVVLVSSACVWTEPRELPVDVDAVEQTSGGAGAARLGKPTAGRQIALDEQVEARGDELHSRSRRRGDIGEVS